MPDAAPSPAPLLPPGVHAALPAACRLADLGIVRAKGDDAATFLQGQLTQDMTGLAPGATTLAGWCSAKGRLQATFAVARVAADEFLLVCSADLLAPTLKRLSMFVLRAKCRLSDASADHAVWGLAGPIDAAALTGGVSLPLPAAEGVARGLWVAPADATPPVPATLPAEAWAWLEVRSAVPRVVARTVDAFVPQMVNLEAVGGVSFRKGCYPGQEIVARSQYRGTLKRRAMPAVLAAAAAPGDEVFDAADPGQPAGQVVLAADWAAAGDARHVALVELKLASVEGGASLHLRSADGPALRLDALPYELPAQ